MNTTHFRDREEPERPSILKEVVNTTPANETAQKIQDLYFATGARVSKATWDETLRLLTTHSAHLVERTKAIQAKLPDEAQDFVDDYEDYCIGFMEAKSQAIDIVKDNK
jgi:hypothetical protein